MFNYFYRTLINLTTLLQICKLTFASWAYDGTQIELAVLSNKGNPFVYI